MFSISILKKGKLINQPDLIQGRFFSLTSDSNDKSHSISCVEVQESVGVIRSQHPSV